MSLGLQPQEGTTKMSASCRVQLPMPVQWGRMRGLGSSCLLTADTGTVTLYSSSLPSLLVSSSRLFYGYSFILSFLLSLSPLLPSFLGLPTSIETYQGERKDNGKRKDREGQEKCLAD